MTGVIIAQVLRLQDGLEDPYTRYTIFGTPLASTYLVAAIIVILVGAFRSWRQQNALLRGKIYAGGWEPILISLIILLVRCA